MACFDDVSMSNPGISDDAPYVPSWCYDGGVAPMCRCGDHHGFHNDAGVCLRQATCGCTGLEIVNGTA
jgi:hypothetical protein